MPPHHTDHPSCPSVCPSSSTDVCFSSPSYQLLQDMGDHFRMASESYRLYGAPWFLIAALATAVSRHPVTPKPRTKFPGSEAEPIKLHYEWHHCPEPRWHPKSQNRAAFLWEFSYRYDALRDCFNQAYRSPLYHVPLHSGHIEASIKLLLGLCQWIVNTGQRAPEMYLQGLL